MKDHSGPSPVSETPLTDAEGVRFARLMIEWPERGKQKVTELVPADFARKLETERAELIELLDELVDLVDPRKETDWADGEIVPRVRALLSRLDAPAPITERVAPEGFALVPVEPTERMLEAGRKHVCFHDTAQAKDDARLVYKAMLSAAGKKDEKEGG